MTPTETTAFLRRYNAWRRGEDETHLIALYALPGAKGE